MNASGRFGLTLTVSLALAGAVLPAHAAGPVALTPAGGADASLCNANEAIPGFKAAVAKVKRPPTFPDSDVSRDSEGWIRIGFTIDAEGETKSVAVLDHVGSRRMVAAALNAVRDWEYEPATLNGQAAEQYGNTVEFIYKIQDRQGRAVHEKLVELYERGRGLVAAGKTAEGIAILERAKQQPQQNLFEQSMVSFALAYAYAQSGDAARALPHIRHAMIEDGHYLEKRILNPAKRLSVRLEYQARNLRYVACPPALAATDDFDPKGTDRADLARIISAATAALRGAGPISRQAKLGEAEDDDEPAAADFELHRRKFSFDGIVGNLSKFRVNCVVHVVEDDIKPTTQWTLPAAAGPCTLRVWGEPGTTFKIVEQL